MTTISRRTALMGTVTLPAALAPLAAMAAPFQTGTLHAEPDPFVPAFCSYVDAEIAYVRACKANASAPIEEHEERVNGLCDAAADAMLEMAQTVPTTPMGLMLAISALLPVFGEAKPGTADDCIFDFDAMAVRCHHTNGSGEALLRSLTTAADRILNNNEPEEV